MTSICPFFRFADCVQLLIALGLFFSYALQFHVAVCYVWPDLKQNHGPFKNPFLAEYGVRVGLALITCKYYLYTSTNNACIFYLIAKLHSSYSNCFSVMVSKIITPAEIMKLLFSLGSYLKFKRSNF